MVLDNDKNLNVNCICGKTDHKPWKVAMLLPCEHMFHIRCIKRHNLEFCPICNTEIDGKRFITGKIETQSDAQRYCDLLSVTNVTQFSEYSVQSVLDNIYSFVKTLCEIPFIKGMKNARNKIDKLFSHNNTIINVRGLDRIDPKEKHVFISNHTAYIDFLIILRFIDTYFLSAEFIKKSAIGRAFADVLPLLIVKRGKKGETVKKMREFVDKYGSICVFPEGCLSHPDTLIRFRTGAFNIGYPIYPIIIKYENIKTDHNIMNLIFKSISNQTVNIYMDVIGPYYPPFNDSKIERIRHDMANVGNMVTSRVTSRDMTD
jgi:hypothetical protein